jgi:glycosyltransferase involved in cell wall biosynthesis
MKPRVSATIICKDEERNIEDCLRSVSWCDEIVVVDSGSADRTVELARRHTPHVIHNPWPGYVAQKNFALDRATGDWVISLDADERCTPEVRDAFLREAEGVDGLAGFEVRRHVRYLGRWINHGGWYPDWKLRIVRRGRARWGGTDPHDKLVPDGPVRRLDAEIHHFTYRDFAHQIRIINHFSDVVAGEYVKAGRKPCLLQAVFHPPAKFLECYLWKLGFLDGFPGFVIAIGSAFYVFARYVKLWEQARARSGDAPQPDGR